MREIAEALLHGVGRLPVRGHVGPTWAVRPWPRAAGGWGASVTTWLEAGERTASLAAGVRSFLTKEQP
ncbi:DUF6228 family protein [Streptomyces filamentosus]|uniref:DUF6228 family protein n=1 Tax=Streptomyces filamentosus TaxID=67294 RepID=UPI003829EED2